MLIIMYGATGMLSGTLMYVWQFMQLNVMFMFESVCIMYRKGNLTLIDYYLASWVFR